MSDIASIYRQRIENLEDQARRLARLDALLARGRIAAFLVSLGLFFVGWASGGSAALYWGGALGIAAFVTLVGYHEHIERELTRLRAQQRINRHGLARLAHQWSDLPAPAIEIPREHAAVANDLDLFGAGSLFQLINRADTETGRQILRDWLLHPAEDDEIVQRQSAVRALAPKLELREEFNVHGSLLADSKTGPAQFIAWAESEDWLRNRPWLVWSTRVIPGIGLAAALLTAAGLASPQVGGLTFLGMLLANATLSVLLTGRVHDIFNAVSTRNGEVGRYVNMFELMYNIPDSTTRLASIKQEVTLRDRSALTHLRELSRIVWLARISHHAFLFLIYLVLQTILLWDFHVLLWLEKWKQRNGHFARSWFQALGEFEALASLASLAHDYPQWGFAEVGKEHDRLRAVGLGHPLLTDDERVVNDVEVGPTGRFLLVTGSNMSGKSTLLRSLGINAVLAQAGAPVCASSLSMPAVSIATSMRITDSLQDHVSFFMAELRRLKEIVDQAATAKQRPLLFLLDEILQGTNSTERHIAVVEVLAHLLASQAFGAVSTHDLELARSDSLSAACVPVHLRETIEHDGASETMTFDYQVRPGIAPTTNALKLLALVGLRDRTLAR